MKINDDHMYHGAALTQIAEHPQFTAINAFKTEGAISRSAFKVNADIGVYLKYASKPKALFTEYVFTLCPGKVSLASCSDVQSPPNEAMHQTALRAAADRQAAGPTERPLTPMPSVLTM